MGSQAGGDASFSDGASHGGLEIRFPGGIRLICGNLAGVARRAGVRRAIRGHGTRLMGVLGLAAVQVTAATAVAQNYLGNTTAPTGPGSLTEANAYAGAAYIQIDLPAGSTITMTGDIPVITNRFGVAIDGGNRTISGGAVRKAGGASSFVNNGVLDSTTAEPGSKLPADFSDGELPLVLHHLVDHPQPKIGDLTAGEFTRYALEKFGKAQLTSGQKALDPYWKQTAIEAGIKSPSPQVVKAVDDHILKVLRGINTGPDKNPGSSMELAIPGGGTLTLRAGDAVIQGYEAVIEAVSPDRKVPVRPINDILKSEARTIKSVDAMLSGTSDATVLDGYLAGIELGKLDIYREHPEFVKPATNDNEAKANAEILQELRDVDGILASNNKNIDTLKGKGYIKESELKSINEKQKELEQAKESGDIDKILAANKSLISDHIAIATLARERAKGARR